MRSSKPSLAVALLALFLAVGGTSYAAFGLPRNSVGTRQLKNGAVTTKKIRNGAVTGAKLNLRGVVVPQAADANFATNAGAATNATNATNATTAATANSLPALTWTPLPLMSGWTADSVANPGNNSAPPSVTKDHEGFVRLRGVVDYSGGTAGIATLPAGFVPAHSALVPAVVFVSGDIARIAVRITSDGTISMFEGSSGGTPTFVSLDGISFYAG